MKTFTHKLLIVVMLGGSLGSFAQQVLVVAPGVGTLNAAIAANGGNKIYQLTAGQWYGLDAPIENIDYHLQVIGSEPAVAGGMPATLQTGSDVNGVAFDKMFDAKGDITLKNIYFVNADLTAQVANQFLVESKTNTRIIIDRCVLHPACVALGINGQGGNIKTYFTNNQVIDHGHQLSPNDGHFFAFDNWSGIGIDTLLVENNTFVCIGMNLFQGSFGVNVNNVVNFNHNTFVFAKSQIDWSTLKMEQFWTNNLMFDLQTQCYANNWQPMPGGDASRPKPNLIYADTLHGEVLPSARPNFIEYNSHYRAQGFYDLITELNIFSAANGLPGVYLFPLIWSPDSLNCREAQMFASPDFPNFKYGNTLTDVDPQWTDADIYVHEANFIKWTRPASYIHALGQPSGNYPPASEWDQWWWIPSGDLSNNSVWPVFDGTYKNSQTLTGSIEGLPMGDLNWFPAAKTLWQKNKAAIEAHIKAGNEFRINIGVPNQPNWTVNPQAFDFDGEVTAEIFIDDVAVTGGQGILGAFVGDQCRGVKTGGLMGPTGKYVFILRSYSNLASGEVLSFRYYDPDEDTVLEIAEEIVFEDYMTIGDALNPTALHAKTAITASRELAKGWTWFSLNVENTDMSIGKVLNSLPLTEGDYIKNQTVSSTYYAGFGWFGELTQIDPREMYKIKLSVAGTLVFEGFPIDPLTRPIAIQPGWNWIGYLPQDAKSVTVALSSIHPVENDYIKNQTASSTFYGGFGWFGELLELLPLDGYMLKSCNAGTLTFHEPTSGTFTDVRDSKTYNWVKIGTQNWMAENLAYLPAVSPSSARSDANPYYYVHDYEGSTVASAKVTANFGTYGVLYNWPAALTACPSGWHLPTDEEWKILEKNQGMSQADADAAGWRSSGSVGGKLKEAGTSHWISPDTGATNSSGFTALPGGYRVIIGGFSNLGYYAHFWSTSEDGSNAWSRSLHDTNDGVTRNYYYRGLGFSVRCLQNE